MRVLSSSEIITLEAVLIGAASNIDYRTAALFRVLADTGARVGDILKNNNISMERNPEKVKYIQEKNHIYREFTPLAIYCTDIGILEGDIEDARKLSYSAHLKNFWRSSNPYFPSTGRKYLSCHFFRHSYALRLLNAGNSAAQIAANIGVSSQAVAMSYATSPIYVHN